MERIREADYKAGMDGTVLPFLEKRRQTGTFERLPQQPVYYEHYNADAPKGVLVLVHGFSESLPKFYETIYYFLGLGYHVWAIQQRGHGLSFRTTDDPALIDIEDYRDLLRDLHFFVQKIVFKNSDSALPRVLYGHSMGGGISACYLSCWPGDFSKAVLSSPMLELNSGGIPTFAAEAFAWFMIRRGKGRDYMPGSSPFKDLPDLEGSCTSCEARYMYWFEIQRRHPEYQMCIPAVRTARQLLDITRFAVKPANTSRITAQVLLFQAGKDTMVKPGGQEKFIRQIGDKGKLVRIPDARHEIYFERDGILDIYWNEIEAFL